MGRKRNSIKLLLAIKGLQISTERGDLHFYFNEFKFSLGLKEIDLSRVTVPQLNLDALKRSRPNNLLEEFNIDPRLEIPGEEGVHPWKKRRVWVKKSGGEK